MTAPRRALVVVDVQQEYFDGPLQIQYPPREESLANIVSAIEVADSHDIPVVVVQHHMPAGAPVFVEGTPGWSLHPADRGGRRRVPESASTSSTAASSPAPISHTWLRDNDIDTVTLVGFMTNNCDLASAVEAEGLGFAAEILSDASGAIHLANEAGKVSAEELHNTLMVLLQSNFAAVATTAEWTEAVAAGTELPKSNLVVSAIEGSAAATA